MRVKKIKGYEKGDQKKEKRGSKSKAHNSFACIGDASSFSLLVRDCFDK